jgi:hypothetical protein
VVCVFAQQPDVGELWQTTQFVDFVIDFANFGRQTASADRDLFLGVADCLKLGFGGFDGLIISIFLLFFDGFESVLLPF